MENKAPQKRIDAIDALRGLAVVLMVIHHALYDAVWLLDAPEWLFSNPVFDILHYIFAGLLIFLSGVSSRFSRSNLKRGIKCFAIALAMTVVTSLPIIGQPIRFGVLHLLGTAMIFYGLTGKIWQRANKVAMPIFCIAMIVGSAILIKNTDIGAAAKYLFPFGWTYPGFYSADWFPLFPWLFAFLLGTWAGEYVKERRLPARFYEFTVPFFPQVGRAALLIYVAHQPVLYGITMLVLQLK